MTRTSLDAAAEQLLRELAPQVLGATMRRYGDFSAAEDAVQEALIAAASQWPRDGMPDNPRGWLIQVASRRMTDHIRSEAARRRRETEAALQVDELIPAVEHDVDQDDTLILLFMCCHEALSPSSAIALTLRAVGGLTTAQIARAFLVPEATMAQRISRAKGTIKASGVPFRLPSTGEQGARLPSVLHVLYLIFNEGYTSSDGAQLLRTDLSTEAIRLTRAVHDARPDEGEVAGLLALMLLTDARRAARSGPDGELIPLDKQDRSLWDQRQIAEGIALISDTLPGARSARTSCRPPLPPSTTKPLERRTPTGRRSWRSTPCSRVCRRTRWCAQSRDRHGHGARAGRGPRAAEGPRPGWATERTPSPARRARAPAGDERRPSVGDRALPRGGRSNHEHSGAELPRGPGRPSRRLRTRRVFRTARSSARRRRAAPSG